MYSKMVKKRPNNTCSIIGLLLAAWPLFAPAESAAPVHPILTESFEADFGVFFPDKNFKIGADGKTENLRIDFNKAFKLDSSEQTGAMTFNWRFGEKWSLQGQYWTVSDDGSAVLDEDRQWEDVVFKEGTFVGAGAGIDVARVFFGRRFQSGPRHEFGMGAGFHWLEISAYIGGQVLSDLGDTRLYRSSVSASAPLPNIGAWYYHSLSPKWALVSRLDWFSASFDKYSGSLWNAAVGIDWALFEHIGLKASWNYFELDVDVDEGRWNGSAEISQTGPFVSLTARW